MSNTTGSTICECGHVFKRHIDNKCGTGCPCNNPTPASDAQQAILAGIKRTRQQVREANQRRGTPFMGAP